MEEISIPDSVTTIGSSAFEGCTALNEIDIPDSVTTINSSAFYGCSALKEIVIPDSVISMGSSMFRNCTSLEMVRLPSSRQNIMSYMFYGCTALKDIILPDTVTTIQSYAFYGCTSLTGITIPPSVSTIQNNAFQDSGLTEITLPSSVTSIGNSAFRNCDALISIAIPDSVTSLGTYVFYDCDALTEVTLGTGITKLQESAFEHCDSLESIILPYRLESIGNNAFKDCVKLSAVTIPRATASISDTAFSYYDKLTIYGVAGTYAETYANAKGIRFVDRQVNAVSVTLTDTDITVNKGVSMALAFHVEPADFTDEVSWKSSNTSVVTVADDGTVKAVSVGTATVKLTVGAKSATCKVTVVQPVTSISLNRTSLTLEALETFTLIATVNPSNAYNRDCVWTTSDASVADVASNGVVTALSKGTATITCAAIDGSNVTRTCTVTVTNTAHIAVTVDELESPHGYESDCSDFWLYTVPDAKELQVSFASETSIEDGFDFLYVYDGNGNQIGKYTGTELAGKTITIPGDTVRIKLVSDSSGTEWGFKVTSVKAIYDGTPVDPTYSDISGIKDMAKPGMEDLREKYDSIVPISVYFDPNAYPDPITTALYDSEPIVSGSGYRPAVLSDEAYANGLDWINYYRYAAGMEDVEFTDELNLSASWGALSLAMLRQVIHEPPKPEDMRDEDYSKAYYATSHSNLSYYEGAYEENVLKNAVTGEINDSDRENIESVGHRQWLLNPETQTMGIGTATMEKGMFGFNEAPGYVTAIRVFGDGVETQKGLDYDFVSWPASGYTLSDTFTPDTAWSVTLNPDRYELPDSSQVQVTLTRKSDGKSWTFDNNTDITSIGSGFDYFNIFGRNTPCLAGVSNAIIFRPAYDAISAYEGEYNVEVTGIYESSGRETSLHYTVTFAAYDSDVGHDYRLTEWVWAADNSTATATFRCANDQSHTKTENATVISETTPATTGTTGKTVYTATVTFGGSTYTDSREVEIPILDTTYTLMYDANGGQGAPAAETKTNNTLSAEFTVSTAKPTRTNYTFKGWATTAGATEPMTETKVTLTYPQTSLTLYAVWEEDELGPTFQTQNLVLSGQIGVNFFMDLDSLTESEREAGWMEFSISGKGGSTSTDTFDPNHMNASKKYYGFTCYVKSIQMAETITATYHYGNGKTVSKTYSVEEYFQVFEEHASAFDQKTTDLIHAIADYGHYMQIYLADVNHFDIGTDYAESARHYAISYDYDTIKTAVQPNAIARVLTGSKVEKANYRLQLGSETTLDVFLKTTDGSAPTNVKVTIKELVSGKTTTTSYTPVKQADGRYLITIPNISAHKLGDTVTITGTAGKSFSVAVSPLSFVYDVLTYNKDTESKDGLCSLYAYFKATVAYKQQ